MAKSKSKQSLSSQQQPYDNTIKSLFEGQEAQILPHFLPNAVYVETLNVEVMRTLLRVDRVYKVLYNGKEHIVHLEFETGSDPQMAARLLDYHAYFHHKYALPVISIIVYPFRTTMATSPMEETTSDGKLILVFHFHVFPLWECDVQKYMQEHSIEMYALLPTVNHLR